MRFYYLMFLLLFTWMCCSIEPVVYKEETVGDYFAYCTLAPYRDKQQVLVGRTVPESLPRYYQDAVVILSGAGSSSVLEPVKEGVYEEPGRGIPIIGDSLYTLSVLFPDEHRIRAECRVPGNFHMLTPQSGDTLDVRISPYPYTNTVLPHIYWSESRNAYYYFITGYANLYQGWGLLMTNYTHVYLPYYPYELNYSSVALPPDFYSFLQIEILAIDSSRGFGDVYMMPQFPDSIIYEPGFNQFDEGRITEGLSHFSGGKGYFNAVNRTACFLVLHVRIVENTPLPE